MRLKKAEKKVLELLQELRELKMKKPVRDSLMRSLSGSEHAFDLETEKSNANQLKIYQARTVKLQEVNEELQNKLSKANATIDRLNQLLQRKETQITKLHEMSLRSPTKDLPATTVTASPVVKTPQRAIPLRASMRESPIRVSRI